MMLTREQAIGWWAQRQALPSCTASPEKQGLWEASQAPLVQPPTPELLHVLPQAGVSAAATWLHIPAEALHVGGTGAAPRG